MATEKYKITHENILESAKKLFLKNGYERTNLREICKFDGVKTGAFYRHFEDKAAIFDALVDEAANGLLSRFDMAEKECFDYINAGNTDEIWKISLDTIAEFIHYIYRYFDSFKLILCSSDGTKYSDYIDRLVERDLRSTYRMFDVLDTKGISYHRATDNELHMILHAYYACIFETILHDFSEETALDSIQSLAEFFSAGWRKLFML